MVDVTRKQQYSDQRVLVKAKRFLNPEFADAYLFFTGGHIELMRNLVAYANRRSTFVSDYYTGYYTSPDNADWDLIQQRVADLEETLMGNNNVIWGYAERLAEDLGGTKSGDGTYEQYSTPVPEGEVHKVDFIMLQNNTTAPAWAAFYAHTGTANYTVGFKLTPGAAVPMILYGPLTLKEGDKVGITIGGCLNGDTIVGVVWGSKMEVPTV